MNTCDECSDPPVKTIVIGTGDRAPLNLCYFHAAEASLLDLPIKAIETAAQELELPFNGLAFILEALCRADTLESAEAVSLAVIRSARTRFSGNARKVLDNWKIKTRMDIGRIAFSLVRQQLVRKADGLSLEDFNRGFTLGEILDVE